jgi:lysine/ornithine N-monooxygenase
MPLQILIATLLALVTLGTQLQSNQAKQEEVTIMGGNQCAAEVIKTDSSNIIVITTLKRRNHSVTIMGVKQEPAAAHFVPASTAWRINERNKQHKRNTIVRAA